MRPASSATGKSQGKDLSSRLRSGCAAGRTGRSPLERGDEGRGAEKAGGAGRAGRVRQERAADRGGSATKRRDAARGRDAEKTPAVSDYAKTRSKKPAGGKLSRKSPGVEPRNLNEPAEEKRRRRVLLSPRFVLIVILLLLFIGGAARPVAKNIEATSSLRERERELDREQKTTRALEKEVEEARSMSYIEQEARRQRLVAPDEILYLVTTDTKEPEVEYRLKSLQSMDEAWERIRQALHCGASRQTGH